ncbi:macrophage mannose receptor 1-like isoform X2 [Brachyhypopomus gauderio]|uniref:macrophage mannose receptor 1-like isoform X2 n=1 Tax=Brachyhypopomus gauderio TaxID=698409 RepID=UPI00404127C4
METISVLLSLLLVFSAAGGSRLRTFNITGYENLTQSEAQTACRRNYTDLVTVYSEEDNSVLANLTEEAGLYAAWIGLYHSQPRYKWSNGDAVTFRDSTQDCGTWSCCVAMKAEGSWECDNCTQKKNFMCYKQDSCHSYQLVLEPMSWYEAQRYCREKYTDLVSIRDQEQNEEVNLNGKNSTNPFWIGLLCDDWEWTDGGLSTYRNWGTDQPQTTEHCTKLQRGKWISVSCNTGIPALCYHSNATVFSAAGGSRLRPFNITGYENLTQSEAQTACRRNYTDLVTVYSEKDNSVLANLTEEAGLYAAWIGLHRSQPRYKWSNGDAVTFRDSIQDCGTWSCCVAMKAEGSWECDNCTGKKNFMCYKQDSCHSYHLVLEPMSWYEAQRYCREKYTDLVSIRDQEQNEEVNLNGKNSTTPFWIGLLCDDWEWADGGLSTYRNWGTDQPQTTGDCTKLQGGKWISVSCSNGFPALCYHSNATGGNRLRTFHIIVDGSLTQSEAQTACRRNYTDLVTVYSEEDNSILANLTEEAGLYAAWIGLHHSPSYKWSNVDAVTFVNLTDDCGTLSCCATMMANGSLNCNNCTEKNHFMCYKQDVIRAMLSSGWEWADGGLSTYRNWRSCVPQPCDCVKLMKDEWSPSACNDPASALCYSTSIHVSEVRMIWEKALDYCKEGHRSGLLRIESHLDQKEVESELRRNKVSGPVWVGLRQSRLFGFWIWSNGMVVGSWTNWKGGRQPELPLSHQCGAIETRDQGYMWMDMNCRNELRVLCEVK